MGLCLHRYRMASPDRNSEMPKRHVIGLSLIAAIAVVLAGFIAVRARPLGPDAPAATPRVAQVAIPTSAPPRDAPVQTPAPGAGDAAAPVADAPSQTPAPPPPAGDPNPPRQIAGVQDRPHSAPPPPMHDPNPPRRTAGVQGRHHPAPQRADGGRPDAPRRQADGGSGSHPHEHPPHSPS
jgi:hypothetical protein